MDGVGEEVGDHLGDLLGIAGARRGRQVDRPADRPFLAERSHQVERVADGLREVELLPVHHVLAGVEPRELEQRRDEAAHALGGALAGFERRAVFFRRARPREGRLRLGEDDRDGRAQLVRGVGGELALLREGVVEPGERAVQHRGQPAELAVRLLGADALRKVARRDPGGRVADRVDGPDHAGHQEPSAGEPDAQDPATDREQTQRETAQRGELGSDRSSGQHDFSRRRGGIRLAHGSPRPGDRAGFRPHAIRGRDVGRRGVGAS